MYKQIIDVNINRKFPQRENMTIKEYFKFRIDQTYEILNITNETHPELKRITECLQNHFMLEIKEIMKDMIHDTEQYYLSFM